MEAHSVSRLIGAPPGYIGHDAGLYTPPQLAPVEQNQDPSSSKLTRLPLSVAPRVLDPFYQVAN
jgi:hypothetical protein